MHANKPKPGDKIPHTELPKLYGENLTLGKTGSGYDWQLIVVYRGKHCPICTRYLRELNEIVAPLKELGIEIVAISADSEARAADQITEVNPDYAVGYGLSIKQMQSLGLYISSPRHGMDVEGPFAEPGLFLVNQEGELRMVDIANVPFLRPQIGSLVGGLKFMRGMTEPFPANGTFA
ncbi:peroxiredoxin-like family protein [Cognatishimia activa]|uniref:peroxiredoxin-like family protein n=1 Tax=Cognatishimia activa TaxID=1715691 RepID=UPI002230EAB0|nr:peroxiredoxin-like family protein [Cognatishimia activa]UZD89722.1 AhpC/TSA family protein [Cognatishimia activa]